MITREQLIQIVGKNKESIVNNVITPLNECLEKYGINTKLRICHFLAQVLHESGSFKYTKEFCSLLEVETPINISFSLHFFRANNVLLDIVLSLCNKVPSKSNNRSLHFFISFFLSVLLNNYICINYSLPQTESFDKANAGNSHKFRFSAF